MKKFQCRRCLKYKWALLEDKLCSKCHDIERKEIEAAAKLRRKPKREHALKANVETYLRYIMKNRPEKFNKRDFERLMGIPFTSVNYLIRTLKKKDLIKTEGKAGAQYFVPISKSVLRDKLQHFGEWYNETSSIREEESDGSIPEEKEG